MSETPSRIPGALARYRVMAFVTGSFLLAVTAGVIVKYGFGVDQPTVVTVTSWIAIVHGWIFVVYLITCVHLWVLMRWGLGRLVYMALGGVIPLLSFFAEHRVSAEVRPVLEAS